MNRTPILLTIFTLAATAAGMAAAQSGTPGGNSPWSSNTYGPSTSQLPNGYDLKSNPYAKGGPYDPYRQGAVGGGSTSMPANDVPAPSVGGKRPNSPFGGMGLSGGSGTLGQGQGASSAPGVGSISQSGNGLGGCQGGSTGSSGGSTVGQTRPGASCANTPTASGISPGGTAGNRAAIGGMSGYISQQQKLQQQAAKKPQQ